MARLSSHFRFLRPSAVAIISASVDDEWSPLSICHFCVRGKINPSSMTISIMIRDRHVDEIEVIDNKL